ncbi:Malate synthase [Handroanthus impetiginosus]|uniref:malate synthase n=1 Tax=Handroanthus impetiginosus TaxID=429701 RepID=A0A2G9GF35_9LAMI|nr:Malate synthase [Handroanthus impetiginosus]
MVSFETFLETPSKERKTVVGYDVPEGVDIRGRYDAEFARILTKDALKFVACLQREFRNHIKYAMECRKEAKMRYNNGGLPGFDPATKYVREWDWVCAPPPPAVADRRVEITGPVERKMIINALNSGAKVFMADFEDALSPSWENLMRGQVNLRDALNGTISFHDKARNRVYKLNDNTANLFVRPRGWHLPEAHIFIDGEPATGCLVDFGLYFFHNWSTFRRTQGEGFGPFFYLPKMEHSRQIPYDMPNLAQLLIELIDVTFSSNVSSDSSLFKQAAQIPIRDDPKANEAALELVRKDKLREVKAGHDGTWAAHPGLIPAIMEVFTNNMGNNANQIQSVKREDAASLTEQDLLQIPRGARTMEGLRLNTRVGIQYVAAWLTGTGSVPLYNLMEDAATAEISRVQNWQWLKYGVELDGDGLGVKVTRDLFGRVVEEEMARIEKEVGKDKFNKGMYREACKIFTRQCTAPTLDDFLTLDAYNNIVIHHPMGSSKL